jgi:hypothetical protein
MVSIAFSELDGSQKTRYRDVIGWSPLQIGIELNWLKERHPTLRWFTVTRNQQRQDEGHASAA